MFHPEPPKEQKVANDAACREIGPSPMQPKPGKQQKPQYGDIHQEQKATRHSANYSTNAISGIGDKR